jgi:hypothetical protein
MSFHRDAKLGLAGRYALVCAIDGGMTLKAAAAAFSARMRLRARLPVTPRPHPRPATLAAALQHDQAAQLDRRPTPDQPHSQRP